VVGRHPPPRSIMPRKPKIQYDDSRELRLAAGKGDIDKLKAEIARGADIDLRDPEAGMSALHYAVIQGQVETAKILIDAGAKLSQQSNPSHSAGSHNSPLDYALTYVHPTDPTKNPNHPILRDMLLNAGAEKGIYVEPFVKMQIVGEKPKKKKEEPKKEERKKKEEPEPVVQKEEPEPVVP